MTPTATHLQRAADEWTTLAGGLPIRVEHAKGTLLGFGEELAVLRIQRKMGCGRVEYSAPLGTWYYSKEMFS